MDVEQPSECPPITAIRHCDERMIETELTVKYIYIYKRYITYGKYIYIMYVGAQILYFHYSTIFKVFRGKHFFPSDTRQTATTEEH